MVLLKSKSTMLTLMTALAIFSMTRIKTWTKWTSLNQLWSQLKKEFPEIRCLGEMIDSKPKGKQHPTTRVSLRFFRVLQDLSKIWWIPSKKVWNNQTKVENGWTKLKNPYQGGNMPGKGLSHRFTLYHQIRPIFKFKQRSQKWKK